MDRCRCSKPSCLLLCFCYGCQPKRSAKGIVSSVQVKPHRYLPVSEFPDNDIRIAERLVVGPNIRHYKAVVRTGVIDEAKIPIFWVTVVARPINESSLVENDRVWNCDVDRNCDAE